MDVGELIKCSPLIWKGAPMKGERVFGGEPPKGERPIRSRYKFMAGLLAVILLEWILWAAYRYVTYPIIGNISSRTGYAFHIFAAPIIGLTPILIYWRYARKEKGSPWKFTWKHLFSSMLVGALAAVILMFTYQFANWIVLVISGYGHPEYTYYVSLWRMADWDWFILMTFTYFFVVGPVEELQYRSFLQDQFSRVLNPFRSIIIASIFFALAHLPVYVLVYKLDPLQSVFTLCWTFTMGSVLGVFYFRSRNIMGPIIMHGLWNWILQIWYLEIMVDMEYFTSTGYIREVLWLAALIPSALLSLFLIEILYVSVWRKDRPRNSIGIGPVPIIGSLVESLGRRLKKTSFMSFLKRQDHPRYNGARAVKRSVLSVLFICILVMLVTAPGYTWDQNSPLSASDGSISVDIDAKIDSYDEPMYVAEGNTEELIVGIDEGQIVSEFKVTVFWEDEDTGARFINEPDVFEIEVIIGTLEILSQGPSEEAMNIVWTNDNSTSFTGDVSIRVSCMEAGNIHPQFALTDLRDREDTGNDVTISIQMTYFNVEGINDR